MAQPHCFKLGNGLSVVVQPMSDRSMATCGIMYHGGARNEDPNRTGLAHFLEHIRFGPSQNVSSYDMALQRVGGNSNAYTDQDVTNYWCELPANQLEVAFWLESDRLLAPRYEEQTIEVQRKVVMEEFKQHYMAPPYGDVHHLLLAQAYTQHPYRWPVIGKTLEHIAECSKEELVTFGETFYHPSNAVLVVAGGVSPDRVFQLAEKWFGDIPDTPHPAQDIPQEPPQKHPVTEHVRRNVPQNALYKAYHMPGRRDADYLGIELINSFFTGGISSYFRKYLIEEKMLFSEIHSYLTGTLDPGLFVIEGKLQDGVSFTKAAQALQALIDATVAHGMPADGLTKVKKQEETKHLLSVNDMVTQADMLAYAKLLGNINFFKEEFSRLLQFNNESIQAIASQVFRKENSHTLYYEKQ
ncbi:MAG: M16 family metallopeptidase [Cytophagales bacterium]